MSRKTATVLLWITALLVVPVPTLLFGAVIPTLRIAELAGVVLITIFVEGAHGVALSLFLGLLGHAAVYAGLLWVGARLLARLLERLAPNAVGGLTAGLVAIAVLAASVLPLYDTPFHATDPHARLLQVYR